MEAKGLRAQLHTLTFSHMFNVEVKCHGKAKGMHQRENPLSLFSEPWRLYQRTSDIEGCRSREKRADAFTQST